jgi:hypothetical protein
MSARPLVLEPHHVDPKCLLAPVADWLRKRHGINRNAQHRAQVCGPLGAQCAIVFAYVVVLHLKSPRVVAQGRSR